MSDSTAVRLASEGDLDEVSEVERAAASMYAPYGLTQRLEETLTAHARLRVAIREGLLWVAAEGLHIVGWALADQRDTDMHLEEINVMPSLARRGVGSALLEAVEQGGASRGCTRITLVTIDFVPWTLGFYAHHGFRALPRNELSAHLVKDLWIEGQDFPEHARSFDGRVALVREIAAQ